MSETMFLEHLPPLAPGTRFCVHVSSEQSVNDIVAMLGSAAGAASLRIAVASYPNVINRFSWLFGLPRVSAWLAEELQCSVEQAAAEIDRLPVRVDERFGANACNPMRFLGFLVALRSHPSVLLYETSGMDPRGIRLLHDFAAQEYSEGALVHVRRPSTHECDFPGPCLKVTRGADAG